MTFVPDDYRGRILVADGDWRLEMASRGWPADAPPARAVLDRPALIRGVAEAFLDAGATAVMTPTRLANAIAVAGQAARAGPPELETMNRQAASLCRAALSDYPPGTRFVFGVLGPVEPLLLLEEIDESTLGEAYAAQAKALADGGADALLCRSFTELPAVCVAVRAARGTGLPVGASLVFDCGPEGTQTATGATPVEACAALQEAGASFVGCDEGQNPDSLTAVVALMRQASPLPILAQPNAGWPQMDGDRVAYTDSPAEFAGRVAALRQAGATLLAGGRGAGVNHVAALADSLKPG
jgi:methionine synthase I (cobalamin-dependent)